MSSARVGLTFPAYMKQMRLTTDEGLVRYAVAGDGLGTALVYRWLEVVLVVWVTGPSD